LYILGTGGGLLENKHRSFMYSGYLFLYWTVDYWKNKHRSFTYSGYLFLYWTADYWTNKYRSFMYSGYLFFTGQQITGKQAQELHILRLLVLLLDGGLLNGGLTGGGFTGAQDGSKASTCLCIQTFFRGQDFSMIPTEYYSGYLYNFVSMMSSVSILMMLSLGLLFPLS
jgi:hypothetical protein